MSESAPFKKFVVHCVDANEYTLHVSQEEFIYNATNEEHSRIGTLRRKFIEDALQKAIKTKGKE